MSGVWLDPILAIAAIVAGGKTLVALRTRSPRFASWPSAAIAGIYVATLCFWGSIYLGCVAGLNMIAESVHDLVEGLSELTWVVLVLLVPLLGIWGVVDAVRSGRHGARDRFIVLVACLAAWFPVGFLFFASSHVPFPVR